MCSFFFFFNDTSTTEIYTLSLHDALPICELNFKLLGLHLKLFVEANPIPVKWAVSQKIGRAHRLNSSHRCISYAVFCLKKKTNHNTSNLINQSTIIFNPTSTRDWPFPRLM